MVSGFQARSYEALAGSAHAQPTATASAAFGLEEVRAVQMRTRQIRPAQGRAPEIGDRLFSEPTAGTQPWREPLFMPHSRPSGSADKRPPWVDSGRSHRISARAK